MAKNIYDNSNLAESYSGVTTPLTFSFARYVYQQVYISFCRMMGVSQKKIEINSDMYPEMVVFIGYRMYYNLINWYRLITLLPGYKFNRRFLEKMMGVEKQYNHKSETNYNFWQKYFLDLPNMLWQFIKIIFLFIFMGSLVDAFNKNFDKIFIKSSSLDIKSLDINKLKKIYISLVDDLTQRWKIPIANDLAVMISTGLADKLFEKCLGGKNVYQYLKLKSHASLISLDPSFEIESLIRNIKKDRALYRLFTQCQSEKIWQKLNTDFIENSNSKNIFSYLEKFGSRSPNELKLESITFSEDPKMFINFLKQLVTSSEYFKKRQENKIESIEDKKLSWLRRLILKIIINWAINSIARREETRFKRTLIFGFARKIFLQMGDRLKKQNKIKNQRDIFYLKIREIYALMENKLSVNKAQNLIDCRKKEMNNWRNIDLPRRIETNKTIREKEKELSSQPKRELKKTSLSGTVASKPEQDIISGESLVLIDFDPTADYSDKILVTRQTDPGWAIVFPLVKGIIVERGGMLSHAAIVARELGIPCLIGVNNATSIIKNDTKIKLDFSQGKISCE